MSRRRLVAAVSALVAVWIGGAITPVSSAQAPQPVSAYRDAVLDDGAIYYWRLGETDGWSHDQGGGVGSSAGYRAQVGQGRPGAIVGDPDGSVELFGAVRDGIWQSRVVVDTDFATMRMPFRQRFAYEIWVRPRSLDGR